MVVLKGNGDDVDAIGLNVDEGSLTLVVQGNGDDVAASWS